MTDRIRATIANLSLRSVEMNMEQVPEEGRMVIISKATAVSWALTLDFPSDALLKDDAVLEGFRIIINPNMGNEMIVRGRTRLSGFNALEEGMID